MKYGFINDYITTKDIPIGFTQTDHDDEGMHTHEFVEIFYVISGEIEHKIYGESSVLLSEGDIVLIPISVPHSFYRKKQYECTHRDIMIRTDVFKDACKFLDEDLFNSCFVNKTPRFAKITREQINIFENKIDMITKIVPTSNTQKIATIKSFIISLIEPFLVIKNEEYLKNMPVWLKKMLSDFIKISYIKQGLDSIVSQVHYDRKYLCKVFKKYTGMTMTEYLNKTRLEYAYNMLLYSDSTILDIAGDLGFSSLSYFNSSFKSRYNMTPKQVRKNK